MRRIYKARQVSIDEHGALVGAGDLAAQTVQAMNNIGMALAAARTSYVDIVKITTYVVKYKAEDRAVIGKTRAPFFASEMPPAGPLAVSRRSRCRSGPSRSRRMGMSSRGETDRSRGDDEAARNVVFWHIAAVPGLLRACPQLRVNLTRRGVRVWSLKMSAFDPPGSRNTSVVYRLETSARGKPLNISLSDHQRLFRRCRELGVRSRRRTTAPVLKVYKRQPMIKKRFEQIKTVHEIAPERGSDRCVFHLVFLAVLVQALMVFPGAASWRSEQPRAEA